MYPLGNSATGYSRLTLIHIMFPDEDYSNTLLAHAREVYDFAYNYRGRYSDSISDAANFYR